MQSGRIVPLVPDSAREQLRNGCHYPIGDDDEGPAQKCYARSIDDYQRRERRGEEVLHIPLLQRPLL